MTKEDEIIEELFEEPSIKFKHHIEIEGNERIIFSGRFGHGKTTFLKEFFKEGNQAKNFKENKYNVISLFPVNYSIATNEDIFKYIKYDIILDMLEKEYKIEEVFINEIKTLHKYIGKNAFKILKVLVSMIPKVGKDIVDVLDKSKDLIDGFGKYKEEESDTKNEANALIKHIEDLEQKEGSLFEDNVVTNVIEKILTKHKEDNGFTENVLIIDDLDRIDPEHIFRILNIFAAHFDRRSSHQSKNKFGFDKIILVCDIENIRNVFKAKFGIDTDFNGYIDKFYSYDMFNYSTKKEMSKYAFKLLNIANWNYIEGIKYHLMDLPVERQFRLMLLDNNVFFADILGVLFDNKQIDLRNIKKWELLRIYYNDRYVINDMFISYDTQEYIIIFSLLLLSKIKGGSNNLKDSIKNIRGKNVDFRSTHKYISNMIYINTISEHRCNDSTLSNIYLGDIPIRLKIKDKKYEISHSSDQGLFFNDMHLFLMIENTLDFLVAKDIL